MEKITEEQKKEARKLMQKMSEPIKKTSEYEMYLIHGIETEQGEDELGRKYGINPKYIDHYTIALPHSCDAWEIALGTKAKCIEDLKLFIEEAKQILEKLQAE